MHWFTARIQALHHPKPISLPQLILASMGGWEGLWEGRPVGIPAWGGGRQAGEVYWPGEHLSWILIAVPGLGDRS